MVCKHILFWFVLVVVLHFISWEFVKEIVEYLNIEQIFAPRKEVNGDPKWIFDFVKSLG